MEKMDKIYDKIFKKIITLSPRAVVSAINGLFQTHYPPDSQLDYNWTEFEDDRLRRTLADTIVTVNRTNAYHIEAMMYEDRFIVVRMFDYGYSFARREHHWEPGAPIILKFPRPMVMYLTPIEELPRYEELLLDFEEQGTFTYRVPVVCYPKMSMEEVEKLGLQILLPFRLLLLRAQLEKDRSPKSVNTLKNLMENDIFDTIREGYEAKLLEAGDARMLYTLTMMLYRHLYAEYKETKELTNMYDESILFDFEIAEREKDDKIEQQLKALREKDIQIQDQNEELQRKEDEIQSQSQELRRKEDEIQSQSQELRRKEDEIQSQSQELQRKEDEIQSQSQELRRKEDEIQSQSQELRRKEEEFLSQSRALQAERERNAKLLKELEKLKGNC